MECLSGAETWLPTHIPRGNAALFLLAVACPCSHITTSPHRRATVLVATHPPHLSCCKELQVFTQAAQDPPTGATKLRFISASSLGRFLQWCKREYIWS